MTTRPSDCMLIERQRILSKLESRCACTYGNVTLRNDGMSRQHRVQLMKVFCRFEAVTLSKQHITPTIVRTTYLYYVTPYFL
mgnify:CR=1 FL=1